MATIRDQYFTLAGPSSGEFKDRGSKFIGYAEPAFSEEEAQFFIEKIKKLHPKARHHCFAWRLGLDENRYRSNDDGEPSGTAGRPILGQIDAAGLTNVAVIVVRYFGGVLLGTSGLINAYREAAAEAIRAGERAERTVCEIWRLRFGYALMPDVMGAVKRLGLEVAAQEFGEDARLDVAIRRSEVGNKLLRIKALVLKKSLEEAATFEQIDGLEIDFVEIR